MKFIPNRAATLAEMRDLHRQAWHEAGVLTIKPDDVDDDLIREILTRIGTELYGERPRGD